MQYIKNITIIQLNGHDFHYLEQLLPYGSSMKQNKIIWNG